VLRGTSTTGAAVEIAIDLERVTNLLQVHQLVNYILMAIETAGSMQKFPTRIPADGA
jgi:hypothetical protein